ncbi:MAG: 16S rRNA (cytidine(1402)-2'-O)-methyltransferase [Gammaproteobacteria bacterium]|nr:16S rRNA (cytidine(1402)-2'-O)-methyltransferase [Gammaproteobacteria bacterium]
MSFYIIPSPIGNLDDFTIRAINTISKLDFLVVENKSSAQKLLKKYNLSVPKIVIYNDHSSGKDRTKILNLLITEGIGGIISEAGTPLISDPGFKLISQLIAKSVKIIPLPGPTSVIPALVASGLPTDKFQFFGFLPRKTNEIKKTLNDCLKFNGTSIFFESPHRVISTLETIDETFGDEADICLAKELSKLHEIFLRGTARKILLDFEKNKDLSKGEFILLLNLNDSKKDMSTADELFDMLEAKLSIKEIAKVSSQVTGINKNFLYDRFLSFSKKT